jgi:hypothetical protein
MTGLLDLPAGLLALVDEPLAALLPAALRVLLWGALAGIAGMALYRWLSPQSRLAALKPELRAAQRALADYDGPLPGLWPLVGRQFRLAFTQLGLVFLPSLAAGLPVILLWTGMALRFDSLPPAAGTLVQVRIEPPPAAGTMPHWEPGHLAPDADGTTLLPWPGDGEVARLVAADGREWLQVTRTTRGVSVRPGAGDWLSASHSTLAPGQPVQMLAAELPPRRFLPGLPTWLSGWEALFLAATLTASLVCKWRWKLT